MVNVSKFGIRGKKSFCFYMGNGCSISTITIDEKGYLFAPPSLATLWQLGRPLTPEMINEQYSPNLI